MEGVLAENHLSFKQFSRDHGQINTTLYKLIYLRRPNPPTHQQVSSIPIFFLPETLATPPPPPLPNPSLAASRRTLLTGADPNPLDSRPNAASSHLHSSMP
jgi:hypothetical protein